MGLIEEKLKFIDSFYQIVKFDLKGEVIESSEEIRPLLNEGNLFENIPLLSSIQEVLVKQKVNSDLKFYCIQSDFFGFGEYLDFLFRKESKDVITWLICDHSDQYKRTIDLQQERNENSIVKEKQKNEFDESLKKLQKNADVNHIFLKIDSLLVRFSLVDIMYVEAYGDYIKLHTNEKTHVSYAKLKNIEEILPSTQFVRIHRSYIINVGKIDTLNQQNVQINNKILPISLTYKDDLLNKIQKLN